MSERPPRRRRRKTPALQPVKVESGAGFAFEDHVGAYLIAGLVAGAAPLGNELGRPDRIDFQVAADGWLLNDVLVTSHRGGTVVRCSMSVKSDAHFGAGTAPPDFVDRSWGQLQSQESPFRAATDFLGLVTAPIATDLRGDLAELCRLARRQEPDDLAKRIGRTGYVSLRRQKLWNSFKPAAVGRRSVQSLTSPGRVLSRMVHLEADFEHSPSKDRAQALRWCQESLVSGDPEEAERLWEAFLALVSQRRTAGGFVTWATIREAIGSSFVLRRRPDVRADWERLDDLTQANRAQVDDTLAGSIHLTRQAVAAVGRSSAESRFIALVGPSGSGKTAAANEWLATQEQAQAVWLHGRDLTDIPPTLAGVGGLVHDVRTLLGSMATTNGWIVLDGIDTASPMRVLPAVAALVAAVRDDRSVDVGIVMTCQQQEWARVRDGLATRNATVPWSEVTVDLLSGSEIGEVLARVPAIARLVLQNRLVGVLRSPKVLDLVLQQVVNSGSAASLPTSTDEASVAGWFWSSIVQAGGDGDYARERFLLRFAERQGDEVALEIPLSDLAEAESLRGLAQAGLCTVREERVAFAHDLYGDWARYISVRSHAADIASYLRDRLASPMWHRAIRLYALSLLAANDGAEGWARGVPGSLPESGRLVLRDLFLDAAIFAGTPDAAYETLWPRLEANDGELLRRFLRRFLHVATVPHVGILAVVPENDRQLRNQLAAQIRLPYAPLWPAVIRFLHKHLDAVVAIAPAEVAGCADLWLRTVPLDWSLREECADLAIAVAASAAPTKGWRRIAAPAQHAWRAMLAAVAERPEAVRDAALRLCGDGWQQTPDIRNGPGVPSSLRHDRPPATRRADPDFLSMCLDTDALIPLIRHTPDLARELLLAALVGPAGMGDIRPGLGIEAPVRWHHPYPGRGPFKVFLREAPSEAIPLCLSLTARAVEAWVSYHDGEQALTVEIEVDGTSRVWTGDAEVFHWYRGRGFAPGTLVAALMALEEWLYDEQDAGNDLTEVLGHLLAGTDNVAIAGLLVAVGCRRPELFASVLEPLLGVAEFLWWDRAEKTLDHSEWSIGLFMEPPQVVKAIEAWHRLSHRTDVLLEVAQARFLSNDAGAAFFAAARERWLNETANLDESSRAMREQLAVLFDRARWDEVEVGTSRGFVFRPPESMVTAMTAHAKESEEVLFWIRTPRLLRERIDQTGAASDDELETLWTAIQEGLEGAVPADLVSVMRKQDINCGLAALLLLRHREWLDQHLDRAVWCRLTILGSIKEPPTPTQFDFDGEPSENRWDTFVADALPQMWSEDPGSVAVRSAVLKMCAVGHYNAIQRLFRGVGLQYAELGEDVWRLQALASRTAESRMAIRVVCHPDPAMREAVASWIDTIGAQFVDGSLSVDPPPWWDLVCLLDTPDGKPWLEHMRVRGVAGIDLAFLAAAFSWLVTTDGVLDAAGLALRRHYWVENMTGMVARLDRDVDTASGEVDGVPTEWEYDVLNALPAAVIDHDGGDERERLWRPLLDRQAIAHYWVERFLESFFLTGLAATPASPSFVAQWKAMVRHVKTSPNWQRGTGFWYHLEEHWSLLMGLGPLVTRRWTAEQRPIVLAMANDYRDWAAEHVTSADSLQRFARFLRCPAAEPLLPDSLTWIAEATSHRTARMDGDEEEELASLLTHVWVEHHRLAVGQGSSARAFRALLELLIGRQNQVALHIASQASGTT